MPRQNGSSSGMFLGKVQGVVEHVFNGSRFKVRVPQESAYIPFTLGGRSRGVMGTNKEGWSDSVCNGDIRCFLFL